MRILMTADTLGGVWTYALDLTRALADHGVEVHLATMGAPLSSDQWATASSLPNLTVHQSHYKLEWMDDPWDDVRDSGRWLRGLEQRLAPDLLHLNGYAHASLDFSAPKLVVGHSCVCSWWRAVKGEEAPDSWNRYRQEVSRGLHAADLVVTPSAAMMMALEQNYGRLSRKRIIPNGRAPDLYQPLEKRRYILAAGRIWDEAKNISALARVAPDLSWPVHVAGDAADPDGRSNIPQNVKLLGKLSAENLAPLFAHAAIYALPARYEPFGLSVLEAALSGCCLVLGDIPSLRENWHDAAAFVEPDDLQALQLTLQTLIDSPHRCQDLASRALNRAARFTPQRMANGYHSAYVELRRSAVGSPIPHCRPRTPDFPHPGDPCAS